MIRIKSIWLHTNQSTQMTSYRISNYIDKIFETPSENHSEWFGYYNYDTLSSDQTKLLCNRITEDGVSPRSDLPIEVGFYDIPSGLWHHIGYSDSWNWQQGCMLQWLNDDEVIYNASKNNHHIAIIHKISTGDNRILDWAIYGITPDGTKSISLDMERAHWCRAYHYESVVDTSKDGAVYEGDGVFEIDLINNTRKRIIPIQDIIALDNRPYFKEAKHWLEHVMINQEGTRFCVLHRFSPINNVYLYKTRLILVDMQTLKMECIPNWEYTQWSHFGWNNNDFCIYAYPCKIPVSETDFVQKSTSSLNTTYNLSHNKYLKQFISKGIHSIIPIRLDDIIRGLRKHYQYYAQYNGQYRIVDRFKNTLFDIDGHPSFVAGGKYVVTDTYPDKNKEQRLVIYNRYNKKYLVLAIFNAYYKGNPASCDLHPKLSRDGKYIVVDSAHDEKHHMLVFKLNWQKIKQKIS